MMSHTSKEKKSKKQLSDSESSDEESVAPAPRTPSLSFTQRETAPNLSSTISSNSTVQVTLTQEQLLLLIEAQQSKLASGRSR
jgi:hypothetical protein